MKLEKVIYLENLNQLVGQTKDYIMQGLQKKHNFRLCENIVPEIVQEIIEKCNVKKNWILNQKQKIKQTLNHYERNQMRTNKKQEVQEFLQEKQKDIQQIKMDTFSSKIREYDSQSPLTRRAFEIQKLKESIQNIQFKKQTPMKQNGNLSSLCTPVLKVDKSNSSCPQSQHFFSSTQIPRQLLQIDLFSGGDQHEEEDKKYVKFSPLLKRQYSRKYSVHLSLKKNISAYQLRSATPQQDLENQKSSQQGYANHTKSFNLISSPIEQQNQQLNINSSSAINSNEAENSPLFQRKVLKLNKFETPSSNQEEFFSSQLITQECQDVSLTLQKETSICQINERTQSQFKYQVHDQNENYVKSSFVQKLKSNRRTQSTPKIQNCSGLESAENISIQNHQQQSSIIMQMDEAQQNKIDIPSFVQPNFFEEQTNMINNQYQNVNQEVSGIQTITNIGTGQQNVFKNSIQNQKLKHISSQQKENRKHNQYKINLSKRYSLGNQKQSFLNQSSSPIKKDENSNSKRTASTHNLEYEMISQNSIQNKQEDNMQQYNSSKVNQQNYMQNPTSIKSLVNLNLQTNIDGVLQKTKSEKSFNNLKTPNQKSQIEQKNDQLSEITHISDKNFKEKFQSVLNQRKFSVANQSTQSLSQTAKEKKQQELLYQGQSKNIHAINILNLQQFIDRKKHSSLHSNIYSSQLMNNQSIKNIQSNQNIKQQLGYNQDQEFQSSEERKLFQNESESINSKQNLIQNNQINKQSQFNKTYLFDSEKSRQNAQQINEILNRSQQCKFRVLNDQKILSQTFILKKKATDITCNFPKNSINNTPISQPPALYSNKQSPHEQNSQSYLPSSGVQYNQTLIFDRPDCQNCISSLSPPKLSSKQLNCSLVKFQSCMNSPYSSIQKQQQQIQQQSIQNITFEKQKNNKIQQYENGSNFISSNFLTSLKNKQLNINKN